jgi:alpha-L-fucosidase
MLENVRQRVSLDDGWRFAFGHAADPKLDFDFGIDHGIFSKTGASAGVRSAKFADAAWRLLDLPHDWAVELWKRSVFNGLAQIIVQAGKKPGEVKLQAEGENLRACTLVLGLQTQDPGHSTLSPGSCRPESKEKGTDPDGSTHLPAAIDSAARITPSARQLAWQAMEYTCFIHFFEADAADADQWARVARDAGMKMVVLTAKHHKGYCLWPTRTTDFSVRQSSWKNGQGDVVGDLAAACRKYGLKLGLYLSPWDMHEPSYGTPAYNDFFKDQLRELLTGYGEVHEVWFDGHYGGPEGRKQNYDWSGYYDLIRQLQPEAVIAICGPDVRWVGNETGFARESEWSVVPAGAFDHDSIKDNFANFDLMAPDLGSRSQIEGAGQLMWYPAEVDVSIRPSWDYKPEEDLKVKSLRELLDIYYWSVGRNSVLLLNLPPDPKTGRIPNLDMGRLMELRAVLDATYKTNLASGARVIASHVRNGNTDRFGANRAVDGNPDTFWAPDEGVTAATLEFDLGGPRTFNRAMLQEQVTEGQRIEEYAIDGWCEGQWHEIARGTTVGYKWLLRFDPVTTEKVRLRISRSRVCPTLKTFGLFMESWPSVPGCTPGTSQSGRG